MTSSSNSSGLGADDVKAETKALIAQADSRLARLDPTEEGRQEDHHRAAQGQGNAERPPGPDSMRYSRRSAARSKRPMPAA